MPRITLTCEICGSHNFTRISDKFFRCDCCGTKYPLEAVRQLAQNNSTNVGNPGFRPRANSSSYTPYVNAPKSTTGNHSKKRTKKPVIIVAAVLVVLAATCVITPKVIIPTINYNKATALIEGGDTFAAYEALTELGNYKDSPQAAEALLEAEKSLEAKDAASIRGAYAEAMVNYLDRQEENSVEITLKQEWNGWQNEELESTLAKLATISGTPTKGGIATVKVNAKGDVTITIS